MLKFYTATTGESSSETKFMTVSKKMGKSRAKGNGLPFKVTLPLGANTMGPLVESSSMPSRPKVNDEVFSPLQPVTRQIFYIVNIFIVDLYTSDTTST